MNHRSLASIRHRDLRVFVLFVALPLTGIPLGHELGRGLGSAMVRAFVEQLFQDPEVTRIQADPSPENERAIRSYSRAGFVAVRETVTPDGPAILMLRERSSR